MVNAESTVILQRPMSMYAGVTNRVCPSWPFIRRWTKMRSLRTVMLPAAIVSAMIIGGQPLGSSRAETVSTDVITSSPKANDIVDGTMVDISLVFGAPVDHQRSTLTLRSSQGDRQLRPRLESAPNHLFGVAGHLEPGAYELVWEARLSGGRSSSGTIPFTVKPDRQTSTRQ